MQGIKLIADSIKDLVNREIALIPVGEESKKAMIKWGDISSPFSLLKIFDLLSEFNTNAVAIICGKPSSGFSSDGLFVIDFDVKYKRDLGNGVFLRMFLDFFADLKNEFRIEETPSGGNHILYRIIGIPKDVEFPSGIKIARRESDRDELLSNPSEKVKCFIESRGARNLSQCFPSPGYKLIGEKIDVGVISWNDHLRIIEFLTSFDEIKKEVKHRVEVKRDVNDWYIEGENPFECFNRVHNGGILEDEGWVKKSRPSEKYDLFSRPGLNKSYWHGASYDKVKKFYNIFTTSSNLEVRAYNPSDLLCILKYGGDKSELYSWLVSQGYGVLKKSVESRLIKSSAKFGTPLPLNISSDSKEKLEEEVKKVKEKYPNGLFWNIDENGEVEISQKKLDFVIISLGFRNVISEGLVIIDGYLVRKVEESRIFHHLINYILRIDAFEEVDEVSGILEKIEESERLEVEKIYNEYSSFINKYAKITIEHLKEFGRIQDGKILVSSKTESFKFFKNCYVSANGEGVEILDYSSLGDKLVLEHLIIDRDFKLIQDVKQSLPYQFFSKAIGLDSSFLTILGYLAHDFIDDSMNAIFVGLGSPGCGKNILFNLLNHITSVHVIDGRQVELDKNLLQSYNYQRILVISDVEQNFKYDFFKNFSSGAASLKKLFKDVVVLKRKKMPKPVILTNFSYKMVEGLERRIVDVEFNDFFSNIKGGVATYFGLMFPGYDTESKGDWSEFDWNCFDSIVLSGICKFLKVGKIEPKELSENSWYKRFHVSYGHLMDYFNENFENWCFKEKIKCAKFEEEYLQWTKNHGVKNMFSPQKYNKALSEYCEYLGYDFKKDATLKDENKFDAKYKVFKKKGVNKEEIENKDDLPF